MYQRDFDDRAVRTSVAPRRDRCGRSPVPLCPGHPRRNCERALIPQATLKDPMRRARLGTGLVCLEIFADYWASLMVQMNSDSIRDAQARADALPYCHGRGSSGLSPTMGVE